MITNFFIPELNNHDIQELGFQQDGATCHTARATIDLLKDTLGDRLISRFGPVNWPPRSCDLTPLDYFLWSYVKSLVYADKSQTLDHLEDNIRRVIADIRPQMLEKVIENWTSRLDYIRASRGSPMPEIIFKIPLHGNPLKKSFTKTIYILTEAYGDETFSSAHAIKWYKRFSGERVSAEDDEPTGRPSQILLKGNPFYLSCRSSGKNRKSPKRTSKNLVLELLPAMAAPNAEVSEC
ncbi:DUF4817 domain-containing protein [Trichonephila clavipes]|nr:DUF4817 domain-containing protein [Trichonephila clavipes]